MNTKNWLIIGALVAFIFTGVSEPLVKKISVVSTITFLLAALCVSSNSKQSVQSSVSIVSESAETVSKDYLNSGYYWEFRDFLKFLPKLLPIFSRENLLEIINQGVKTEEQMMAGRKWLSREQAVSSANQMIREGVYKDGKYRILFFEDETNGNQRCSLDLYLRDGGPRVNVHKYIPRHEWRDGNVSYSSK